MANQWLSMLPVPPNISELQTAAW